MANLNFQQPPRSIANASLTGRTTGGFGGSSLSGHVTPTSGMFPTGGANYGQTPQSQLSPNRSAQLSVGGAALASGRPNLFGQRPFVERRGPGMQGGLGGGPMANMGNFMQAARAGGGNNGGYGAGAIGGLGSGGAGGGGGPLNNFHNVFGGGGDAPALLDPSEFPSLTNVRGHNDQSLPQTNPLQPPGSKPYGNFFTSFGMVKQPNSEQSEFTMSNEDFPALPGTTQNSDGTTNSTGVDNNLMDGTEKPYNPALSGTGGNNSGLGAVGTSVSVSSSSGISAGVGSSLMSSSISSIGLHGTSLASSGSSSSSSTAAAAAAAALNNLSVGSNSMMNASTSGSGNGNIGTVGSGSGSLSVSGNSSSSCGIVSVNNGSNNNSNNSMSLNTSGAAAMLNAIGAMTGNSGLSGGSSSNKNNSNNIDYVNDNNSSNDGKLMRVGVQTHPDGKVTNIPTSMVNNQFGMVGLLTFIRAAETDQNLVTLALGTDLTGLGLNLNSQESLHPTFAGPFADHPCRAQDVEYNVPHEYLINFAIRDKLATPVLKKLQDDLLFFLFYTNIGDIMQLMAAAELHSREWRYHIEEKIWITRIPGINQYEKNGTKERGTFYYFDAQSWKRLSKDFQIDAEKLDKCPNISSFGQSV